MKKYRKLGEKFILPKKLRVLEVVEDTELNCLGCYYIKRKKKCNNTNVLCNDNPIKFIDITSTLSESDQLLLERGLLKL